MLGVQEREGDEGWRSQGGLPGGSWTLVFRKIWGRRWGREKCREGRPGWVSTDQEGDGNGGGEWGVGGGCSQSPEKSQPWTPGGGGGLEIGSGTAVS